MQSIGRFVVRFCLLSAIATLTSGCYLLSTDERFNYGLTANSSSQDDGRRALELQDKLNGLTIGSSEWSSVQALFGKPERLREGGAWRVYWRPWKTMTVQHAEYPTLGVSFSLLTNPYRLYSVTIETQDVVVRSLRVGHTLQDVKGIMGEEGWWWSTDTQEFFWLDFRAHGLRFAFERDKSKNKYPMSLAKPETVIKIERYDRTVEFFEGDFFEHWINFRFFEPPPIAL